MHDYAVEKVQTSLVQMTRSTKKEGALYKKIRYMCPVAITVQIMKYLVRNVQKGKAKNEP